MRSGPVLLAISVLAVATFGGAEVARSEATGTVTGTIVVKKDGDPKKDASGVVLYLEVSSSASAAERKHAVTQKDIQFTPTVSVVMKGTTVDFPNEDKIFHNVFSVSQPARFDLGLYKSGESKSVPFNRVGVVDIYCNIHPDMAAKVKVVDTPYFTMTKPDGSFAINGVPPGTYPIVAWQAYGAEWRGQVTVTPGGRAAVSAQLIEGDKPTRHDRKDGTPYGRYQ